MTPTELLELADLNLAEATRDLARRAGGTLHEEDGLLLWAGAHSLPVLCNGALCLDTHASDPRQLLERADAFFSARQRGYTFQIRAHLDTELAACATAAGFKDWGTSPGMVLDHPLPLTGGVRGFRIERVASDADARDFAEVMGQAYATYGMPADCAPAILGRREVQCAPHITTFLAREARTGAAAAGAMCISTHGVAGIYWVGTTPEQRGKGLGEACTRAAVDAGFARGARIANLQASVMGEPIYRRMGFVEVTRYPALVRFGPQAQGAGPA